jgi:hypothetical protein
MIYSNSKIEVSAIQHLLGQNFLFNGKEECMASENAYVT